MALVNYLAAFLRRHGMCLGGVGALAFTSGSIAGYVYAKRKLEKQYIDWADQEIESAREFYNKAREEMLIKQKAQEPLFMEAAEAMKSYQGLETVVDASTDTPTVYQRAVEDEAEEDEVAPLYNHNDPTIYVRNVFQEPQVSEEEVGDIQWEQLVRFRNHNKAYIISEDEFLNNEPEYPQVTLTYFAGDGVLIDEQEKPVLEIEKTIGEVENLKRFGLGTSSNHTLYIRNERLGLDFEILRDERKYTEVVLGFSPNQDIQVSHESLVARGFR